MTTNQQPSAPPPASSDPLDGVRKKALDAAIWVTCSPHEWVWPHDQQVAMAQYCIEAASQLELWRWLTEEMRSTVQENSAVGQPRWAVLDVDGEIIGQGKSPLDAIKHAKRRLE